MTDAGKIVPPLPAWPTRPVEKVRRRAPGQETPAHDQRDPSKREQESPDDDKPHVDEYA